MLSREKDSAPIKSREESVLHVYGLFAKKLGEVICANGLREEDIIKHETLSEDKMIIRQKQKNSSVFLVDNGVEVRIASGKIVQLKNDTLVGEGSLLGQRGLANADCIAKKGSKVVEIPHAFLRSIMQDGESYGGKSIFCLKEDRDAITTLLRRLKEVRDAYNIEQSA